MILAATTPGIPIVWDEGEYLLRSGLVAAWFRLLVGVAHPVFGWHPFSAETIQSHWLFINYAEGHPAWFAVPLAFGSLIFKRALDPLTAARLGAWGLPVTLPLIMELGVTPALWLWQRRVAGTSNFPPE